MPLHLLVKWEVVSPNSREGQLESISIISSIPVSSQAISKFKYVFQSLICLSSDFVSQMWGWFRKNKLGIQTNYFSFNISSYIFLYAGNIEKCPFTYSYWLNGRWFLQIVDIGHFIMRLEILKSAPSLTG